jgi:hypothetical protein
MLDDQRGEKSVAAIGGSRHGMAGSIGQYSLPCCCPRNAMPSVTVMKSLLLAFVVTLAANPVLAAEDGYPPGLFEHSPVVPGPNDPSDSQGPPSDAGGPPEAGGPPDGNASLDDYCAHIASHTFQSLAEVKRAHAQCDSPQDNPPPDQ